VFFSLKNRIVRPTKIATFWPTKGNHCCVTPSDWYYCFNILQQWCRRRGEGGASAPPKVWFGENPGKICENLRKILENLNKLPENTSKNGAQCALIWKNGAQKVAHNFFGQVWGNLGKNPSHLKILPAPTPTYCSKSELQHCCCGHVTHKSKAKVKQCTQLKMHGSKRVWW